MSFWVLALPMVLCFVMAFGHLSGKYTGYLDKVQTQKDVKEEILVLNTLFRLKQEALSVRLFFLGLVKFEQTQEQKKLTDSALRKLYKQKTDDEEGSVWSQLTKLRDEILSGQIKWNQANSVFQKIITTIKERRNPSLYLQNNFYLYQRFQEAFLSTQEVQSNFSYVLLRDMPLNGEEFSNLTSAFEKFEVLNEFNSPVYETLGGRWISSRNQQHEIWKKIKTSYLKILKNSSQGNFNLELNSLQLQFERMKNSLMAPIEYQEEAILSETKNMIKDSQSEILWQLMGFSLAIILIGLGCYQQWRRSLFYLLSDFVGHKITIKHEEREPDQGILITLPVNRQSVDVEELKRVA